MLLSGEGPVSLLATSVTFVFLQPEVEAELKEGACLFGVCLFVCQGLFVLF